MSDLHAYNIWLPMESARLLDAGLSGCAPIKGQSSVPVNIDRGEYRKREKQIV